MRDKFFSADDFVWNVPDFHIVSDIDAGPAVADALNQFCGSIKLEFKLDLGRCFVKSDPLHKLWKGKAGFAAESYGEAFGYISFAPIQLSAALTNFCMEYVNDHATPQSDLEAMRKDIRRKVADVLIEIAESLTK